MLHHDHVASDRRCERGHFHIGPAISPAGRESGSAIPDPDLKSERALNAKNGYGGEVGPATLQAALFYSKVEDMIHSMPVGENEDDIVSQNVGDGTYKGFEVAANWQVSDRIGLVGNYTWLHRDLKDPQRADFRPTDTPRHSAFLRLDWQAMENLTVSPSVEVRSDQVDAADRPRKISAAPCKRAADMPCHRL